MSAQLDPADRAWPDDPPFDVVSMLEVCDEARRQAISAREHAAKMMVPFALHALLDGRDPRTVAEACGFGQAEAPEVDDDEECERFGMSDAYWALMGRQTYGRPDPLAGFTKWLQAGLADLVRGEA